MSTASPARSLRRARRAARAVQHWLETFYGLERAPDVRDFVRLVDAPGREQVLVRERSETLELCVLLPSDAVSGDGPGPQTPVLDDGWLQIAEGVSHFVYLAERARTELPATLLELELQGEVDKFVLVALCGGAAAEGRPLERVRRRLYEDSQFLHPADSELGARYRLANDLAARFVARLVAFTPVNRSQRLRAFYRAGQAQKIRLATAA